MLGPSQGQYPQQVPFMNSGNSPQPLAINATIKNEACSSNGLFDLLKTYWWVLLLILLAYLYYRNQQQNKSEKSDKPKV